MNPIPPIYLFQEVSWLNSILKYKKMAKEGHWFKVILNTYNYWLPVYFINKNIKYCTDGYHLVMEYLKDGICFYLKNDIFYFY